MTFGSGTRQNSIGARFEFVFHEVCVGKKISSFCFQFVESIERPPGVCYSSLTLVDNGRICLYGGQTEKAPRGSKIMWICEGGHW